MQYQAPPGTRDIFAEEVGKWQYLEETFRKYCSLYGYTEIRTPLFEQTELFTRSVGEDSDICLLYTSLGIYKIKWELEDNAFRYLKPEAYYRLADKLAKKRREREQFINRLIEILQKRLEAVGVTAEIRGRPKHLYSIYHKMKEQDKDLSLIHI